MPPEFRAILQRISRIAARIEGAATRVEAVARARAGDVVVIPLICGTPEQVSAQVRRMLGRPDAAA